MAKDKSIIKLKGTLGELTFYQSGGETIVKQKTSLNGNKIKNDPAFQRTRENNQEFGGAAKVGKSFRMGFAGIAKNISDRYWVGRVGAQMRNIINRGTGARGQRTFEVSNSSELLTGFEFNAKNVFDSMMLAPSTITVNPDRTNATWDIPDFNVTDYLNAPSGATHFRLVLCIASLSNYNYETTEKTYMPVVPDQNEKTGQEFGNFIPLEGQSGSISINATLNLSGALDPNVALNIATGIIFYQEINGTMYELSSNNAMKIAQVAT